MAGRIPNEFIDQLLGQTDIVRLIGQHVALKKSGANYMACCPFHEEKTPSFSVHPRKQFFHCFGCGESGSAIGFLMKYRHMTFVDAVEELAKQAGLTVPKTGGSELQQERYRAGLDALQQARQYFARRLHQAPEVLRYLRRRGLNDSTIKKYALGYAPKDNGYLKACFKGNYNEKLLTRIGLMRHGDNGAYEFFRDRIIFPILDRRGQTIAFGGRALSDSARAKYLNSPETSWFKKSRTVYGEFELKETQRDINTLFVVEGYMDVVSLSCHGVPNAIATLGTAVTEQHLRTLLHLSHEIVFCFDGDNAGHKAAVKTMEGILPYAKDDAAIRFMFLPDKHDPDSFVLAHSNSSGNGSSKGADNSKGAEEFRRLAEQADLLSEFLIKCLTQVTPGKTIDSAETRAAFITRARSLISPMPPGALKMLIMRQVAERAGITTDELKSLLSPAAKATGARHYPSPPPPRRKGATRGIINKALTLLLHAPELAEHVGDRPAQLRNITEKLKKEKSGVYLTTDEILLCDLLDYIRADSIKHGSAIITRFVNTEYEETLNGLYKKDPLLPPDIRAEFSGALDKIIRSIGQKQRQIIIEKSAKEELSAEEKSLLAQAGNRQAKATTPQVKL